MTMYMCDVFCVTNRKVCREDFLTRVEQIASCHPAGIILREKDMSEDAYTELASAVMEICNRYGVKCILHTFTDVAIALHCNAIHLPLPLLRELSADKKQTFAVLGASCHSIEDALEAQALGCTYITAGHVFETDCKKGLPGRGLAFLQNLCEAVEIPVYAIGGIAPSNITQVKAAGASGVCLMSSLMVSEDVEGLIRRMEEHYEV